MKRKRQQKILEIIAAKRVATQQDLVDELARQGLAATQSSVSRDIEELELTKVNGRYTTPERALHPGWPVESIDTAGDNLIVVKTEVGQAQPAALAIDGARIKEVVGTVAGDDTIMVAVRDRASQRVAVRRIIQLFERAANRSLRSRGRTRQRATRSLWP
ncbi:MAG TPA: arginine repressor [Blastocatellia bacterium]|nr:arginine repressor [Blastocatellia bacterium]